MRFLRTDRLKNDLQPAEKEEKNVNLFLFSVTVLFVIVFVKNDLSSELSAIFVFETGENPIRMPEQFVFRAML